MSRRKPSVGWQEAGGEFYQESFPGRVADVTSSGRGSQLLLGGTADSGHRRLLAQLPSRRRPPAPAAVATAVCADVTRPVPDGGGRASGSSAALLGASGRSRGSLPRGEPPSAGRCEAAAVVNDSDEALPDTEIPDERQVWLQVQAIKQVPLRMETKRQRKLNLMSSPAFRLHGMQRFWLRREKLWRRVRGGLSNTIGCHLWHDSLRRVESNMGTAVLVHFVFLKRTMLLHLALLAAVLALLILPSVLMYRSKPRTQCPLEDNSTRIRCCPQEYSEVMKNTTWGSPLQVSLDLLRFAGFAETTPLLYGVYSDVALSSATSSASSSTTAYNLPLVYLLVPLIALLTLLISTLCSTAECVGSGALFPRQSRLQRHCRTLFGGWDFCTSSGGDARHRALYEELRSLAAESAAAAKPPTVSDTEEQQFRSGDGCCAVRLRLYGRRVVANLLVLAALFACAVVTFQVARFSSDKVRLLSEQGPLPSEGGAVLSEQGPLPSEGGALLLEQGPLPSEAGVLLSANNRVLSDNTSDGSVRGSYGSFDPLPMLLQTGCYYLPAVMVSRLSNFVPPMINFLVRIEQYSSSQTEAALTLLRAACVRLTCIVTLVVYTMKEHYRPADATEDCSSMSCWENAIGRLCYNLMLADLVCQTFTTLFFMFPLRLISDRLKSRDSWLARLLEQAFEADRHLLDVIFNQLLCWTGVFFAPMLPAMAALICFCMFYLKLFMCLYVCGPPRRPQFAHRLWAVHLLSSLLAAILAFLVLSVSLSLARPSTVCGPLSGVPDGAWSLLEVWWLQSTPRWFSDVLHVAGSPAVIVPLAIALLLSCYYQRVQAAFGRSLVVTLKRHLQLEAHDKQFLLARLHEMGSMNRRRLGEPRWRALGVGPQQPRHDLSASTEPPAETLNSGKSAAADSQLLVTTQ